MLENFATLDLIIFFGWIVFMMAFGIWISRRGKQETAKDYFLASKSLPWWAVGGSLIASNISAEQFIGMSGSGYVAGLAIATYELMAAVTLIIIAKYFLPIFIKEEIYTMPQFLEVRFNKGVRTGLAIFWVLLFVFVNITTVLYLGGLALETIMGIKLIYGVIGLAIFASTFSIIGGLKAVVWTDVVQVIVLVFGGILASVLVLSAIGGDFWSGFQQLMEKAPEKFDMILSKDHPEYMNLPGISVLIGGMWVANLYYWGTNQYIIQRSLAAKSAAEAQKGTIFAAFVKIVLPLIVVVPGIAAFVLGADIDKPDQAYPWVLSNYMTVGFKGLAFAALIAAIGSSLSSMVNSTCTIFTLDIYRDYFWKNKTAADTEDGQKHLVKVGRYASAGALIIGILVAPALGSLDQVFQHIQEYTGLISPGVLAIFLLGLFWKKTSSRAAMVAIVLGFLLSLGFKFWVTSMPFMNRMGLVLLLTMGAMVLISYWDNKKEDDPKAIAVDKTTFKTSASFNISTALIVGILAAIYTVWW